MELELGAIVTGKVTGITKFGAFVTLEGGKSGLVHISEIANSYVAEVTDKLTLGQEVTVKIIGLDPGKINFSIKAALPPEPRSFAPRNNSGAPRGNGGFAPRNNSAPRESSAPRQSASPRGYTPRPDAPPAPEDFEDRLQRFMKDSDSKISGIRRFSDKKGGRKRR